MLRWAEPPDDVWVDESPFDRGQVLLAWQSKCDNAIAQGWIGNREFHTARIGSPRREWLIATSSGFGVTILEHLDQAIPEIG